MRDKVQNTINYCKAKLKEEPCQPDLIAYILRDIPELAEHIDIHELAWSLSISGYCTKNDVIGLIENIEETLK